MILKDGKRLTPFRGYEIVVDRLSSGKLFYYGVMGERVIYSSPNLNTLKSTIRRDWRTEIKDLMKEFHKEKYYEKVIFETVTENPDMSGDGLYRMAHKKVMGLI